MINRYPVVYDMPVAWPEVMWDTMMFHVIAIKVSRRSEELELPCCWEELHVAPCTREMCRLCTQGVSLYKASCLRDAKLRRWGLGNLGLGINHLSCRSAGSSEMKEYSA